VVLDTAPAKDAGLMVDVDECVRAAMRSRRGSGELGLAGTQERERRGEDPLGAPFP